MGRRIPVALQARVESELKRLKAEGHVKKLRSCTDDQFISPIVITVKRDGSIKLAMDSKMLNEMVSKNKHQEPNIEELVDKIGQIITSKRPGKFWFTVLDLRYAYGQLLVRKLRLNVFWRLSAGEPRAPISNGILWVGGHACRSPANNRQNPCKHPGSVRLH